MQNVPSPSLKIERSNPVYPFQILIKLRYGKIHFAAIHRINKAFVHQLCPQRLYRRNRAIHEQGDIFRRTRQSARFYHGNHEIQLSRHHSVLAHLKETFIKAFLKIRENSLHHLLCNRLFVPQPFPNLLAAFLQKIRLVLGNFQYLCNRCLAIWHLGFFRRFRQSEFPCFAR